MAKFELKFIDCYTKDYIKTEAVLDEATESILISGSCGSGNFFIYLDKSTAIKFAKTLRAEINKIEREV